MRWVFGYGSLIFRPSFPFEERRPAVLPGFERRFWQGSTDHRGVPGAPGRVVTLVPRAGARCWGVAYRIAEHAWEGVLGHLDFREKGGYERRELDVELDPDRRVRALVYWALPGNDAWLGEAPVASIAAQIRGARGPSGDNADYVRRLAGALREAGASDEHVFDVEAALLTTS